MSSKSPSHATNPLRSRRRRWSAQKKRRLHFQPLEERRVLATYSVIEPTDAAIREAIVNANANPGPDVIELTEGTYELTASGANENLGATGDLDITDDLVIRRASDAGNVTLDASGISDRVFHVIAPLRSAKALTVAGSPALESTRLNELDFVDTDYVAGDRLQLFGRHADGSTIEPSEIGVGPDTTVAMLLDFIQSSVGSVSVSLDPHGRITVSKADGYVGATQIELIDGTTNTGSVGFPGFVGAEVTIDGIEIRGGNSVPFGGGVYSQNQAVVTLNESVLEGNSATDGSPAFLNDFVGNRGGMIRAVNTRLANNVIDDGVGSVDVTREISQLLTDNMDGFLEGIDSSFGGLATRIEDAFSELNIPVVGDQLINGLEPILDGIRSFATDVRNTIADVLEWSESLIDGPTAAELIQSALYLMLANDNPSTFGSLSLDVQNALQPFKGRLQSISLGLLNDGPDSGTDIDQNDVVVTIGQDQRGKRWLEYNFHIGQHAVSDTGGFDFGLANLLNFGDGLSESERAELSTFLNNLGFQIESTNGLRFDMRWDIRMGLGISEVPGQAVFLNSGATLSGALDSPPVQELRASVDVFVAPTDSALRFSELSEDVVTTPNLRGELNLGLTQAIVTDGTPASVTITAPSGLPVTGPYANDFDITYTDSVGDHTIQIRDFDFGATPADFVVALNAALLEASTRTQGQPGAPDPAFFPISATLDFGRINRTINADAGTGPSLVFIARLPEINNLRIDFASAGGDASAWGFIDGQFEDRRSKSLGFANAGASQSVGEDQRLLAELAAPANGKLIDDIDFVLWLGGSESDMDSAQKVRITIRELLNRDMASLEELGAKLESVIRTNVASFSDYNSESISVSVVDAKLQLSVDGALANAPERLTVTSRQVDQTKLQMIAAIDIVDPDFASDENLINLRNNPNDQRYFDRVTLSDLREKELDDLFKPVLNANADINLHVKTDSSNLTGFVSQQLGIADDAIGLPEVEFDFKVVGAKSDILDALNSTDDGDADNDSGDDDSGNNDEKKRKGLDGFSVESLQFDNITLDVSKTLESVVAPFAESVLSTLQPVFNVLGSSTDDRDSLLNTRIDIISDIVDADVTIGDVIDTFGLGGVLNGFYEFVEPLQNFDASAIASEITGGSGRVVFGGLELVLDQESVFYFPKFKKPVPIGLADTEEGLKDSFGLGSILSTLSQTEIVGGFVQFDLLKVESIFNMLTGSPFDIVSIGLPKVDIDAEASFGFDFDVLAFDITAEADVDVNLRLVYDSLGISRLIDSIRSGANPDWGSLLDGFYIRNNPGATPEIGFDVSFNGSGSIDLGVVEANGFVSAGAGLGLNVIDPNDDGRLRLDEILALTNDFQNPERLVCLFDITGSGFFNAGGSLTDGDGNVLTEGELGLVGGDFSLQELLSNEFGICSATTPTFLQQDPVLASEVIQDGIRILQINAGPFAANRVHGDTDDADATSGMSISVTGSGSTYQVSVQDPQSQTPLLASGDFQTVTSSSRGFDKVIVVGTDYNDTIDLSGIVVPAEVIGGDGDDMIIGGFAGDMLNGGEGNDTLLGGGGQDAIDGGEGNDMISGGDSADQITGGPGNDTIHGDSGKDTIEGGTGTDELHGGADSDDLFGGPGPDRLFGDDGHDNLFGGSGNDILDDRDGRGRILGELGNDTIVVGRLSQSQIDGGGGLDSLVYNDAEDTLTLTGARLAPLTLKTDTLTTTFHSMETIRLVLDQADSFTIVNSTQSVEVDGGNLEIDRSGEASTIHAELDASSVVGLTDAKIDYQGLSSLTLRLGESGDQLLVQATAAGVPTEIHGGNGDDEFIVDAVAPDVTTSINGGMDTDAVTVRIFDNPRSSLDQGNLNQLALTTESLIVDHSQSDMGYDWKSDQSVVSFREGGSTTYTPLIDAIGAQRVMLLGRGNDRITVTNSNDAVQIVAVNGDSVVIQEGAEVVKNDKSVNLHAAASYQVTASGLSGVSDLVVDESGEFVYAVSRLDDSIVAMRLRDDGRLETLQVLSDGINGIGGLDGANQITRAGRFLYVIGTGQSEIAIFETVPGTGRLVHRNVLTLNEIELGHLVVSDDGRSLFATDLTEVEIPPIDEDDEPVFRRGVIRIGRNVTDGSLTLRERVTFNTSRTQHITSIAYGAGGNGNVFVSTRSSIKQFHLRFDGMLPSEPTDSENLIFSGGIQTLKVSDGRIHAGVYGGVAVLHYSDSHISLPQPGQGGFDLVGNRTETTDIAIHPDGSEIAVGVDTQTTEADPDIRKLNLHSIKVVNEFDFAFQDGKDTVVLRISPSDGQNGVTEFRAENVDEGSTAQINDSVPYPTNGIITLTAYAVADNDVREEIESKTLFFSNESRTLDFKLGNLAHYRLSFSNELIEGTVPTVDPLHTLQRNAGSSTLSNPDSLAIQGVTRIDSLVYAGDGENARLLGAADSSRIIDDMNVVLVNGQTGSFSTDSIGAAFGKTAVSPDGRTAFSLSGKSHLLFSSDIASNGSRFEQSDATRIPGLTESSEIAVDNRRVYVTVPSEDSLYVFDRSGSGTRNVPIQILTDGLDGPDGQRIRGLSEPGHISVHGDNVYVTSPVNGNVAVFAWQNNRLVFKQITPGRFFPLPRATDTPIQFSPDGAHGYATFDDVDLAGIQIYPRSSTSGRLMPPTTITMDSTPTDLAVSPDGQYVYVASRKRVFFGENSDFLTIFRRDDQSGALEKVQTLGGDISENILQGLHGLEVTHDYVFATYRDSSSLAVYSRNAETGRLALVQRLRAGAGGIPIGTITDRVELTLNSTNNQIVLTNAADQSDATVHLLAIDTQLPDPTIYRTDFSGVTHLQVTTGGQGDQIQVNDTKSVTTSMRGGAGEDQFFVNGGGLGPDTLLNGDAPGHVPGDVLILDSQGMNVTPPNSSTATSGVISIDGSSARLEFESIEQISFITAPTADAGGEYEIVEGESLLLDASGSVIPDPTLSGPPSFEWDLNGDGVFGDAVGESLSLNWSELTAWGIDNGGEYEIALRVSNDEGSNRQSSVLSVLDRTVSIVGPGDVNEGDRFDLQIIGVETGESIFAGIVHWGDATSSDFSGVVGNTISHVYSDNGVAAVSVPTLTIQSASGLIEVESGNELSVVINNLPANVAISGPETIDEGSEYSLELSSLQTGDDTIAQWNIDWGDGTSELIAGNPNSATHRFSDDGQFLIRATASDEDGTYDAGEIGVTVENLDPSISATEVTTPSPVEGSTTRVAVSAADPAGLADPLLYQFDFLNDGTIDVESRDGTARYFFADDGAYPVRVLVSDGDNGSESEVFSVAIGNVAPEIAIHAPAAVDEGQRFELTLSVTDPGEDTLTGYVIDWGDGTVKSYGGNSSLTLHPTHVYADGPGNPVIRVFDLSDEDGLQYPTVATTQVSVRDVRPTIELTGQPLVDAEEPFELTLGPVVDQGDDPVIEYRVDWGDGSTFDGLPYQSFTSHPNSVLHEFSDESQVHHVVVSVVDDEGLVTKAGQLTVANEGAEISLELGPLTERTSSIELTYVGTQGDVSSSLPESRYSVSDGGFSDDEVFVLATDSPVLGDPSARLLFFDSVTANTPFTINAQTVQSTRLPANLYLSIFSQPPTTETFEIDVDANELQEYKLSLAQIGAHEDIAYWLVDWGDGQIETISGNPEVAEHVFATPGDFLVSATPHRFTTSTNDGNESRGDIELLQSVRFATTDRGLLKPDDQLGSIVFGNSVSESTHYQVDWDGNGVQTYDNTDLIVGDAGTAKIVANYAYGDNGVFTAAASVSRGGETGVPIQMRDIVVNNVAPVLTQVNVPDEPSGDVFGQLAVTGKFTDAGSSDSHQLSIHWGDGEVSTATITPTEGGGAFTATHAYQAGGFFTIVATLTDDDGAVTTFERTTLVSGVGISPDGTLFIVGNDEDDQISIHLVGNANANSNAVAPRIRVYAPFLGNQSGGSGKPHVEFPASDVQDIRVITFDGNDRVVVKSNITLPVWIDTGEGDDYVVGGGGVDQIFAGPGQDRVLSRGGDDVIDGGPDRDVIFAGEGRNTVDGGDGNDVIFGGSGAESIHGGSGNDVIISRDGDDTLIGGAGQDRLFSGKGDDVIEGGPGNDRIFSGQGKDTIDGGEGNDRIFAGGEDDTVHAGPGIDYVDAGRGNDIVHGGDGHDLLDGRSGNDSLYGDDGNDLLIGGTDNDQLHGGANNDRLMGNSGNDLLIGGTGSDRLHGGSGNNTLIEGERAPEGESRGLSSGEPTWVLSANRDVNGDGQVTALDALLIINQLGKSGNSSTEAFGNLVEFMDTNRDQRITVLDALHVINALGQRQSWNGLHNDLVRVIDHADEDLVSGAVESQTTSIESVTSQLSHALSNEQDETAVVDEFFAQLDLMIGQGVNSDSAR